jgi:hypothetical protein
VVVTTALADVIDDPAPEPKPLAAPEADAIT